MRAAVVASCTAGGRCGTKALRTRDMLLTEAPRRGTDSASVLTEEQQPRELLLDPAAEPVKIRRPKGIERQWQLLCRSCNAVLAYRSADPKYLYVHADKLKLAGEGGRSS